MDNVTHLQDFQVIEFRRYIAKEGERQHSIRDNRKAVVVLAVIRCAAVVAHVSRGTWRVSEGTHEGG